MKKIIKSVLSLTFLGAMASQSFSLDFGGLFKDYTKVETPDFSYAGLTEQASLDGWVKIPLSKDGKLYFTTEADATIRIYTPKVASPGVDFNFMMNLSLLKLTYTNRIGNGYMQVNMGRFSNSDATGTIVSQETDGIQFTYSNDVLTIFAHAGYTGLTNARYNTIVDSNKTTFVPNPKLVYQFNSPYVLGSLSFGLPYLFSNQSMSFEAVATVGLPGIFANNLGFNRFYGSLLMNGPLLSNLFYSASTTFGFTTYQDSFLGASNLTKFSIVYYPEVISSSINFDFVYASGNNGFLKPFNTFTSQTASLSMDDAGYSGIIKANLGGTIRPVNALFLGLDMAAIFDCMDGFGFEGFQWSTQAQIQFFTDFKVGLSVNQFYGSDSSKNNTAFTLNFVLAF